MQEGFHFDQSYIDWDHLALGQFSRKDFGFLLLYFLDKMATEEIKTMCQTDIDNIKKEMNR